MGVADTGLATAALIRPSRIFDYKSAAMRANAAWSRMPAGSRGRPMTATSLEKRSILATVSAELDRIAFALADDDGRGRQAVQSEHVDCRQCMADCAEIAADHQQQRDAQRRHPIKHRAPVIKRHHDAAHAFDKQHAGSSIDRAPAEADQFVEFDRPSFRAAARSGESGARKRQGAMRSIASAVTGLPSARSSTAGSLVSTVEE